MKTPKNIILFKVAPKCIDCGLPMVEKGETTVNLKNGKMLSLKKVELYQCSKCLNTYIVEFKED